MAPLVALAELNRTLLERQGLLERGPFGSAERWVERLAGLNAQYPSGPFISLWARCRGFEEHSMLQEILERRLVRSSLMRGTLHLATHRQFGAWKSVLRPALARVVDSFFPGLLGRIDVEELASYVRGELGAGGLDRRRLGRTLTKLYPQEKPEALAFAARLLLPLIQAPENLRFGYPRVPRYEWFGHTLEGDLESLIHSYLEAFGPATLSDFTKWSGLPRTLEVVEAFNSFERVGEGPDGRPLHDVGGGRIVEGDVQPPVRLLPDYDNVLFAHADRSRIVDPELRWILRGTPRMPGVVLVDGFVKGIWSVKKGVLEIKMLRRVTQLEHVEEEGENLRRFLSEKLKLKLET